MISRASLAISLALFAPAFLGCGGSEETDQTQPAEQPTQTAQASPTAEQTAEATPTTEPTAPAAESAGYPAEVEKNFMNACQTNGGSASQCSCALDEVKKEFTYDEYLKEEAAVAAGGKASRGITDAIAKCR